MVDLVDEREQLLELAISRLGSLSEAEHVVCWTYRRWFALPPSLRAETRSPRDWLTAATEHICADLAAFAAAGAVAGYSDRTRARRPSPRRDPGPTSAHALVFAAACRSDDRRTLDRLLAPMVTAIADGGGQIRVPPEPVRGVGDVSRFLRSLFGGRPELDLVAQSVNGDDGMVASLGRRVVAVVTLDRAEDGVRWVWIVANPSKLRQWNIQ